MLSADQSISRFQIELSVIDKIGVLTAVTAVFAQNNVSISAVAQEHKQASPHHNGRPTCTLRVTTHAASQADLNATIDALRNSVFIAEVRRVIRVEES